MENILSKSAAEILISIPTPASRPAPPAGGRRFLSAKARASPNGIDRSGPLDPNDPTPERSGRRIPVCYYCKEEGHVVGQCTKTPCRRCRQKGHKEDECNTEQCSQCDRFGHNSDSCWVCDKCGRRGHLAETCRAPQCEFCKKYGHTEDRCFGKVICEKCGRTGHPTEKCNPRDSSRARRVECGDCGELGHSSRECENPYVYRR